MKKLFLLVVFLFLTGCSVQYHIDFVDDSVSENISFISANSNEYNAIKSNDFAPIPSFIDSVENLEEPIKNEGTNYYDVSAKNNNIYLDYKFNISDFEKSYFVNNCYGYFKVFQEDSEYVFSTDKKFLCPISTFGADKVDIVITTNHEVIFNNAHEVDGDRYIWHITPDNVDEANIQISFSKSVKKSGVDKIFENYSASVLIFGGIVIALCVVFGIIIRLRYRSVNKI